MIRPFARFVAVLLVLGAAVGCGAGSGPGPEAPGGYTVTHAMGETRLPARPARVVVLDSPHLDALVALGTVPVGASVSAAGAGYPPYLADRLTGTESTGLIAEPDLEAVVGCAPT